MKFLLYCTKGKELWGDGTGETWNGIAEDEDLDLVFELNPTLTRLNGKIVAQCDCKKIERIFLNFVPKDLEELNKLQSIIYMTNNKELLEKSCLSVDQIDDYLNGKIGYALHLCNLEVFDNPKKLIDFGVKKAPQNMMKVFDYKGNEYILISIRPEHLANILNGKKTIEVRKKILKCMGGLGK